ncbi:GNAT family N-acetyltransferase [Bordetella sp. H567]|uniref:GNAT family N-acetyltransferase n=1 Tax=Bordetella sp. H567 TaxID=1697043 RepID=UPI000977985C|nr:GNAT family N-acetyltransferase [Bordetella sp. H567]
MTDKFSPLTDQQKLLNVVFPDSGFSYDYLKWLYRDAPDGNDISSDYREAEELLGHYTILPQRWYFGSETKYLALSLNTAVHERARGKGMFTRLAEESYAAAATMGVQAVIGVANANSTPGFLRRLKFKLIDPLPVVAGVALPALWNEGASHAVTPEFLDSTQFKTIASCIEQASAGSGVSQAWTLEKLKWRLASPRSSYALHTNSNGTLITTTARAAGCRTIVALKFFAHSPTVQVDGGGLLRKAAGFHRSPIFIYCGFNGRAVVRGLPLPRRFLPSPLNLIYRRLDDSMPKPDEVKFDTFEFLDFDAY